MDMDQDMDMDQGDDHFELPEDLQDVEIIYSDGEDNDDNPYEELEDLSRFTFTKHEKSVFAIDISPDEKYLVTGSEDDMAFVWDMTTKEVLLTCTGHKDSVTQVGFNHDGKYVATADMGGLIQVWNIIEKKLVWSDQIEDLEWLQWHPVANVLIGGFNTGIIYIWQIPSGNCKALSSHGHSTTCGKILPDGIRLIAGYADGGLILWDLKSTNPLWKKSVTMGITALDINSDGTLLGIAPTSQLALISDGRNVANLKSDDKNDLEAIIVSSELGVVITGSISGEVCVYNLSKHLLRHTFDVGSAVTVLKLGRDGKVFIGVTGGAIYYCDVLSGTLVKVLTGHVDDILDIAVPKTGNYIVSSSDDGSVKIFDV